MCFSGQGKGTLLGFQAMLDIVRNPPAAEVKFEIRAVQAVHKPTRAKIKEPVKTCTVRSVGRYVTLHRLSNAPKGPWL